MSLPEVQGATTALTERRCLRPTSFETSDTKPHIYQALPGQHVLMSLLARAIHLPAVAAIANFGCPSLSSSLHRHSTIEARVLGSFFRLRWLVCCRPATSSRRISRPAFSRISCENLKPASHRRARGCHSGGENCLPIVQKIRSWDGESLIWAAGHVREALSWQVREDFAEELS